MGVAVLWAVQRVRVASQGDREVYRRLRGRGREPSGVPPRIGFLSHGQPSADFQRLKPRQPSARTKIALHAFPTGA